MIKCSEYYGVQFVQGHYLMHWESRNFESLVDKLFVQGEDISVSYEGLGAASGHNAVKAFFARVAEMSEANGGLLRLDMPHTQLITVDADGCHATGEWETMTYRVMGAAFGNDLHQAPLSYAIGRYCNRFALEDGIWKLVSIDWKPVIEFGDWHTKDATAIYKRPSQQPYPELRTVDDSTASPETIANLQVRTAAMGFFHDFNRIGLDAIDDRFTPDAAEAARRMLTAPCKIGSYGGSAMVTSPIVAVEPTRARLYFNVGRILPVNDQAITHSRGRINAELQLTDKGWQFTDFQWHRYATMDPWPVK